MPHSGISFIGAGKVASSLALQFRKSGFKIISVYSRGEERAKELALKCDAMHITQPVFGEETKVVIVSVSDNSLGDVLKSVKCHSNTIIAHTAGSYGLELFRADHRKKAVFYPLQTFSENRNADLKDVPLFVESSEEEDFKYLADLAEKLGFRVVKSSPEQRKIIHLAAVFVSNFTNFMLTSGKEIVKNSGISFDLLYPLVYETVCRAFENGPDLSQTGPAVRHDTNTMQKHLNLLSFNPELENIYRLLSESIINYYSKKQE